MRWAGEAGRGWLAAGFGLSTLPWVCYFGFSGAVYDWLKVYLWDNLFLYSAGEAAGAADKVKAMLASGVDWFGQNLRYTVLIVLGLGWFAVKDRAARPAVWLAATLGALGVFIGGKSYPYYGLALAGLAVLGLIPVGLWLDRFRLPKWLGAAALGACLALCPILSHNMTADYGAPVFSKGSMQSRIAAYLPENASLLNYGFMDAGFYTAAGTVPQVKYFHQTNVPLEEMTREQRRYVEEALCEYVVTRAELGEGLRYELIAVEESPGFWYEQVYLYRRIDE